jgi:adenosylcobinamide-GDP ribazoletransferase
MPSARPGGLGAAFVEAIDQATLVRAAAIAGAVALLVGGAAGIGAALAVALATFGIRTLALRRLGGTTGDVIGATGEVTEALALAVFAWGATG